MILPKNETAIRNTESTRWYRRYATIIVVACLGLFLTFSAFFIVRRLEIQRLKTELQLHAQGHVNAVEKEISNNFNTLRSLHSFFKSSEVVTREEFRIFTEDMLQRAPGFQAIEWIPRVLRSQREGYERAARLDGFKDFQITERQTQGEMIRAGEREEYFPAYFVEPYKGNEIALGYDLASNPAHKSAMEKSRDTGQMIATGRTILAQDTGEQYNFLVFLPVYGKQALLDTVETRRKNLIGFMLGVYRVGTIANNAFKYPKGLTIHIYDKSSPPGDSLLYTYSSQAGSNSNQTEPQNGFEISHELNIADRQWQLVFEFSPDFVGYLSVATSWGVLAGGLVLTCLLAVYLATNIKRTIQMEEMADRLSAEVAEREQAGEALRESRERYRNILESIEEGYYETDLSGNYTFCNNAMCKMSGYSKDEFIGKNYGQFVTPAIAQEIYEVFTKIYTTEKPSENMEYEAIRADGQKRYLEVSASLMKDSEGRPVGFRGIARDVTRRRLDREEKERLEGIPQQSQKMEAIGTLAGGIAHDFNNILTSIIGYAELALIEVKKESILEDDIKEIKRAGKRASDLVQQVLAFSRQTVQEVKPIRPSLIIKETVKLLRAATPAMIDIKQNINSDSQIMGDQTCIHRVLMNLCTNAVHAMKEKGGTLEVDLRDVELYESQTSQYADLAPGKYLKLAVSDTGSGIPPDMVKSIFDPYFTTKGSGEGTGLGLSVVHGIVKELKGEIALTSEPGIGTTFTVYLPILEKKADLKLEAIETLPLGTERILFVDDEASIVKMFEQVLSGLGYTVTARTSSIEALELFRNRPYDFDIILTDMRMPNMTGIRLTEEMIKIRSDIPVILCTGYSDQISEENAAEIGIRAFLKKPFITNEVAKTIRKALD